jgi:dTMP kinase
MSLFITFEGIEGSGKSTQIRILNDFLKLRGHETVSTREPGGTPIGNDIRKILLHPDNKGMTYLCELFLYAAGRAQHMENVITPALRAGKTVLCDRFIDATLAYQGYGRGFPLDLIRQVNKLTIGETNPGLTILLDCDASEGLKRARDRNAKLVTRDMGVSEDRFENESLEFHKKVRTGYLEIARQEPQRIMLVDASREVDAVHQEIVKRVLPIL